MERSLDDIYFADFKKTIETYIHSKPILMNFYFRLGPATDFNVGYIIGNGKLLPFENLPKNYKKGVESNWRNSFSEDREGTESFAEYKRMRHDEWYMHIALESIGEARGQERAALMVKRNMNIYNFAHSEQYGWPIAREDVSPYGYCYDFTDFDGKTRIETTGSNSEAPHQESLLLFRDKEYDGFISALSQILVSDEKCELDTRIVQAIDVFGMIDDNTPLYVRFMLCVIALEGLLSKGDRGTIRARLCEYISFLLGDSEWWLLGSENELIQQPTHKRVKGAGLVESRSSLYTIVGKMYDKRSGFAHTGRKGEPNEEIIVDDYMFVAALLRKLVERLVELRRKGIEHLIKKPPGKNSLEDYVENLKFSGSFQSPTVPVERSGN